MESRYLITALDWLFAAGFLIAAILLTLRELPLSRDLFLGKKAPLREYVIASVRGTAPFLLLLPAVFLFMAGADSNFRWTAKTVAGFVEFIVGFGLILGLFDSLVSLWAFFIVGKFREELFHWLRAKAKK